VLVQPGSGLLHGPLVS